MIPYIVFAVFFVLSSLVTAAILSLDLLWPIILWLVGSILGGLVIYGLEWLRQGRRLR